MLTILTNALEKHNNVTLPNFGGLMKMGKSFMFNEFLKFNDGKLAGFIQEEKKISKEEAEQLIAEFIAKIKAELESTGKFSLGKIGDLTVENDKIKLVNNKIENKEKEVTVKREQPKVEQKKTISKDTTVSDKENKSQASNSTDLSVKEAKEKIENLQDKQELIDFTKGDTRKTIVEALNKKLKSLNKIDTAELNIVNATSVKEEKDKPEKPIKEGTEKEVKKQVSKESDILKTVLEEEAVREKSSAKKEEIKAKETTSKVSKKEQEDLAALTEGAIKIEKEAKSRKRNKIILWLAIICILSGGGIIGYIKQDIVMSWFESDNQIAEVTEKDQHEEVLIPEENNSENIELVNEAIEEIEDTTTVAEMNEIETIEEDIVEEEPEVIEDVIEEPVAEVQTGSYTAIVGSFSKESNAINLVRELKEKGFSGAKYFQNGNLQSVTLGSYQSRSDAKKDLEESEMEGWVKKI